VLLAAFKVKKNIPFFAEKMKVLKIGGSLSLLAAKKKRGTQP
jgi:hypothetical protein